jgi:hypothetical protein
VGKDKKEKHHNTKIKQLIASIINQTMQDQDDASSSQSKEKEAASPAKEMETAADQDDASSSLDLHRSVIDSLDEVPKFSEEAADLADEDDEASSIHANGTTTPVNESITTADEDMPASAAIIGIEQMPSTNDAPIPLCAAMSDGGDYLDDDLVAKKAACAKPELMHDDLGPDANTSLLYFDSMSSNKKPARSSLETIEDDSSCPLPLHYTDMDDLSMERKVGESKSVDLSTIECDNETAHTELPAESTGDIEHAIHEARPTEEQPDINPSGAPRVSNFDDESIFHSPQEEDDTEHEVAKSNVERSGHDDQSIHTPLVKAWAVDEESEKSVYMAEEVVETPWWKQRRTKLLLAVVVLVVVLAVTSSVVVIKVFGLGSGSQNVAPSQSPSTSWTPTSSPSNAPSSSPTECVERMHSSMQTIDLEGEVDDWYSAIAVDGSNMVVVATGVFGDYNGTVIKFFSLAGDGVWERSISFKTGIYSTWSYASLSDKTAFVKIDSEEIGDQIFVYEQNTIGEWEKVQDPIKFGDDVELGIVDSCDIDGDLAYVTDIWFDQTHILHRNGSKWIHFDTKDGTDCTIFGDTVAIDQEVYMQESNIITIQKHLLKYNEIQNALSSIQDPILSQSCGAMYGDLTALSNEYLAFWDDCDVAIYIYRLDPESETYIKHQQLPMKGVLWGDDACWIGMDNNVLVVAGFNETFIVVDQGGTWVQSTSMFDEYHIRALSDRNAIFASDGEVRAYTILDDCTQPMPTSTPSSEPSSASPTHSSAPSVSLSPSASSSPTQCMKKVQLDLQINYPREPKVAVDGSNLVVAVHDGDWNVSIQFYSLANIGEWTTNLSFQFNATELNDVALSGNTALVSFWESPFLVFEQSAVGEWEITNDPFVFRDNATKEFMLWVGSVDVDGDLACLTDFEVGSSLFRRNDSKWTEVRNSPTSVFCALANGTIAVTELTNNNDYQIQLYEYNEGQDAVLPIQDPIILEDYASSLALSNDYLVNSDTDGTVFVYKRNMGNRTYILHQKLTIPGKVSIWDLSLYENTLVVDTDHQTNIFSEQNGSWVERAVLYQKYYQVAVSGQNLVASTDTEVYSYNLQNIEDCMTPTPSSTPSLKP